MESPSHLLERKVKRSRWCLAIACTTTVATLIAIIVTITTTFSRRANSNIHLSTILVPLYIYPSLGAWNPLFEAVTAFPELRFVVIINPEDGPGSSHYPNDDYTPLLQRLNAYSNVRMIGYVRTGYTTRNLHSVLNDVDKYSGWASHQQGDLSMHGIFFDEVPSEFSQFNVDYLNRANQAVKQASGLRSEKLVVHNPGTIPDARFNDSNTDFTVVFEGSYPDFNLQRGQLASLEQSRPQNVYVIHSVPQDISMLNFVDSLGQHVDWLFVTSLEVDYYESFGSSWREFVNAMATRGIN